jgi:hypothetical protein
MTLDTAAILAEIKANRAKLDGCAKHRFDIGNPPYRFGTKLTCQNCGGVLDAVHAFSYTQGFKAAGGNPNDVIPGFE